MMVTTMMMDRIQSAKVFHLNCFIFIEEILVNGGCDPSVSNCIKCNYSLSCLTCDSGY
jgi:hypothetical protein